MFFIKNKNENGYLPLNYSQGMFIITKKAAHPMGAAFFDSIEVAIQLNTPTLHLQIFHFQLTGKGLIVIPLACGLVQGIG